MNYAMNHSSTSKLLSIIETYGSDSEMVIKD